MGKDITASLLDFNPNSLGENDIKQISIESNLGKNTIDITNNSVCCIESDCPDKICVKKGKIINAFDNEMIICVPHNLIIYYK